MEKAEPRHKIVIYGLVSFHGTQRAKLCVKYLRKYLRHLYEKVKIKLFFDVDWIDFVNRIRIELGEKFRRLYYLKHPVIIFLDDKYIGDHRALIQHVTCQHGIIPDLPYPDLFPDFTNFLPKRKKKGYAYLDLRVGDLSDYVVGKMVFELHKDIVPETCKYFSYLCEAFGSQRFNEKGRVSKLSYLGSSVRRICSGSFVQGGVIDGSKFFRVNDENFTVKHDRRGVLSLANQGGNRSSTEFVISLKPNSWMDRTNVAFGQLIFGESLLEAIEEIPTYYQSPLKDIVVVGCGVIPTEELRGNVDYETKIMKMKDDNTAKVIETKRRKLDEIISFEKEIDELLKRNEDERRREFIFTGDSEGSLSKKDSSISKWLAEAKEEASYRGIDDYSSEGIAEEIESHLETEDVQIKGESEIAEENIFPEDHFSKGDSLSATSVDTKEITLEEIIIKAQKKDNKIKTEMMTDFILSILQKSFVLVKSDDDSIQLGPKAPEIKDVGDIRDVPSGLFEERYHKGLYSLPASLKKLLVDALNTVKSSELKLLGEEARSILSEGGIPEESLNIYGSEALISGILMTVIRITESMENFELPSYALSEDTLSSLKILIREVCEDTVEALKSRGPDFIRNSLASKSSEDSSVDYAEQAGYLEDFGEHIDENSEDQNNAVKEQIGLENSGQLENVIEQNELGDDNVEEILDEMIEE